MKECKINHIKCVSCNQTSNVKLDHKCDLDCVYDRCYNNCNQMWVSKKTFNIYCPDCASGIFENESDICSIICYKCENVDPKQFYCIQRYNDPKKWYNLLYKNTYVKHPNIYCKKCFTI